MKKYNVTGMSCAACVSRVEKAVNTVDGVSSCSVSLLTNSMTVDGTASPEKIIAAVTAAGYGASEEGTEQKNPTDKAEALGDKATPLLKKRLFASLGTTCQALRRGILTSALSASPTFFGRRGFMRLSR